MGILEEIGLRFSTGLSGKDVESVAAYALFRIVGGEPDRRRQRELSAPAVAEAMLAAVGCTPRGEEVGRALQERMREPYERMAETFADANYTRAELAPGTAAFALRFPKGTPGRDAIDAALDAVLAGPAGGGA